MEPVERVGAESERHTTSRRVELPMAAVGGTLIAALSVALAWALVEAAVAQTSAGFFRAARATGAAALCTALVVGPLAVFAAAGWRFLSRGPDGLTKAVWALATFSLAALASVFWIHWAFASPTVRALALTLLAPPLAIACRWLGVAVVRVGRRWLGDRARTSSGLAALAGAAIALVWLIGSESTAFAQVGALRIVPAAATFGVALLGARWLRSRRALIRLAPIAALAIGLGIFGIATPARGKLRATLHQKTLGTSLVLAIMDASKPPDAPQRKKKPRARKRSKPRPPRSGAR